MAVNDLSTVIPLETASRAQLDHVRAEVWCWTIAHYEEQLVKLRDQDQMTGGGRVTIVHVHRHGEPCNTKCKLRLP
jgi:hypothetical protein